ncbi:HDOD domain-containing protein [Massilia terrae]|uniref:HDOD domain-containing protein n=1 Tax=Massilia terrae TaxID=1811224 RepID=A0ABT2CSC3_9BURK|nr:HDOD domain-containing protein [Massilia terrae]MCS0656882.1 HDOD domain-containing protein [Massilia terrae]
MNTLTLEQVVAKVRDLPSLPSVVVQLIRTFGQADVAVAELSAQIAKDQALAAKTLRLANSSFYGLQSRVRTIDQAITVLGFDSVRALVTSAGIVGQFGAGSHGGLDFTAFWRHAVGTALCAKSVARLAGSSQEYAFVSGLLHDIGRLVLATRFPDEYAAALALQGEEDCEPSHAERQVLGLDHAVVGRALAQHWKFPELIQRAIGNHHAPMRDDLGGIASVVHVANVIVHALDLDGDPDELVPPLAQDAWDSLGIEAAALQRVFAETEAEFEQACQILTAGE